MVHGRAEEWHGFWVSYIGGCFAFFRGSMDGGCGFHVGWCLVLGQFLSRFLIFWARLFSWFSVTSMLSMRLSFSVLM